jgi:hypothetical protein
MAMKRRGTRIGTHKSGIKDQGSVKAHRPVLAFVLSLLLVSAALAAELTDILKTRPNATQPLNAGDKIPVIQGGVMKIMSASRLPQGPAGPAGPQGERGFRGYSGAQGEQGLQGPPGPAHDLTQIPGFVVTIRSTSCPPSAETLATLAGWGIDQNHIACLEFPGVPGTASPTGVQITISAGSLAVLADGTVSLTGGQLASAAGTVGTGNSVNETAAISGAAVTITGGELIANVNGTISIVGATTMTTTVGSVTATSPASGTVTLTGTATSASGGASTIYVSYDFNETVGTAPPAYFTASTASSGTVATDGSGNMKLYSGNNLDGALLTLTNALSRSATVTHKMKFQIANEADLRDTLRIMSYDAAAKSGPTANTSFPGFVLLTELTIGAGPSLKILFTYKDTGGTLKEWKAGTGWQTYADQGRITLQWTTYYVWILEMNGTQFRYILKNADESSTIATTDWVNWSSVKAITNSEWLTVGDWATDAHYGKLLIDWWRVQ